jgi:hypothetical protein
MPAHDHYRNSATLAETVSVDTGGGGGYVGGSRGEAPITVTGSTGGSTAHNNLQPYIVVYMWKRTA